MKFLLSSGLLTIFFALAVIYHTLPLKSTLPEKNFKFVIPDQVELQNGDLIFRKGRSIESQIVLLSDGSSEYSHVGIICIKNNEPFVVHAVPSESDSENELVKMETVKDFLSIEKASRFAVYRLKESLACTTESSSEFAYNCYLNKYSFDNKYDLSTDKNMYCTELIWKAYKNVGVDLVQNRLYDINFIVINKKMIMPSSIIKSKFLKLIHSN